MLVGQTLFGSSIAGIGVDVYYTPWFERHADSGTFFLQTIARFQTAVGVDIEHKNSEDTDASASTVGSFSSISAVGTAKKNVFGLKELIRLKISVSSTEEFQDGWTHVRVMPPMWQPN